MFFFIKSMHSKSVRPEPGWYRGDFHAHTHFSDGEHSPAELVKLASAEGLDFVTITDHHSIAGLEQLGGPADVVVIPGMEVTFRDGHFNVFGVDGWSDWMEGFVHEKNQGARPSLAPSDILRQTAAQGLLNSINHPLLEPWVWRDEAADMTHIHCVEVWNDPSWPDNQEANPQALKLWTKWLNAGCLVTAIGGSDYHRPEPRPGEDKPAERLGLPGTYVLADELSSRAILQALRHGRAYVSLGPRLSFEAHIDGQKFGIGAQVGPSGDPLLFDLSVSDLSSKARALLIGNGETLFDVSISPGNWEHQLEIQPAMGGWSWYRLDLYDSEGGVLAFTNPVFLGRVLSSECGTYGDFLPL